MAGYFYPPPPSRIGGNQPYAPKLGISQSGPLPDAPPIRGPLALATLALVVSAWTPQQARAQSSATIAPLIPDVVTATQVPYSRQAQLKTIQDAWTASSVVVLGGTQVAPLLATPPTIDSPPPSTNINLNVLLRSWHLIAWPVQYRPYIATQPIVDSPPIVSRALFRSVIQSWAQPWYPSQGYTEIAPILPVPVVAGSPPVPSIINLQTVIQSWTPPWMPPQGFTGIAPILPQVDYAPTRALINYELIGRQWQPRWTGPDQVKFAPLAPLFLPIPDVVGNDEATGTTTLQSSGFVVSVVNAYSDTVPAGDIISETPVSGTQAQFGSEVVISVSLGVAPVVITDTQTSGGWSTAFHYEQESIRRRHKRKKEQEEAEREQVVETDAEIARFLHEQESKDDERKDLERLQSLVKHYEKDIARDMNSERINKALKVAKEKQTLIAYEILQREIERSMEEDEFALLMLLANE